jgi:membrane protein DedA with SNARE-associated domain
MRKVFNFLKPYSGKILLSVVSIFFTFLAYKLYYAPVSGLENKFLYLLEEQGYIILFAWSILEGELGLIMGGLMSHKGSMNLYIAIFVAGLGGFAGDQIYFYIGRFNKRYVTKQLKSQRRKFALAHLLIKKYGWPIIFMQRYMYGLRTVIPISIGLTRYSAKKFALINLISAWCWATITILPAYFFGEEILKFLLLIKTNWYFVLLFVVVFGGLILYYLSKVSKRKEKI